MDEMYFDKIDTQDKAYWFGFLCADGYVDDRRLVVQLAMRDIRHLQKLRWYLKSDSKIRVVKPNGKCVNYTCRIYFNSKRLAADLQKNGCVHKKSNILTFPNETILPKHLIWHFIRGYFDGDGCLSYSHNRRKSRSKKLERQGDVFDNPRWYLTFVGTYEFLYVIQSYFNDYPKLLHCKGSDNTYQLKYGGNKKVKHLASLLYKDSCVCLDRKYHKYKQLMLY